MIILDTNVISEVMRAKPDPGVIDWLNQQARSALYLTTVTLAEVSAGIHALPTGARRTDLERRLDQFLIPFDRRILTVDTDAALRFGSIVGQARRNGEAISFQDGLIAAIVQVQRSASIATRDVRPFQVAGLNVINPWEVAQ